MMTVMSAQNIGVEIDGSTLLDNISLSIKPGELIGLIGPNGAGKSTLLKTLLGLQSPSAGRVMYQDRPLENISNERRGRQLGYVAQGSVCHWPMTVHKVVEMGRLPYQRLLRKRTPDDLKAIEHALNTFDIVHLKDRLVSTLSGGERARVMLARAFAGQPRVLFADEPTADLDPGHQLQVMNVLKQQVETGVAVVVVLHDLNLAARYCDRLYLLEKGRMKASGVIDRVINAANMKDAYGIEALIGQHEAQDYIVPWRLTS